MTAVLTKERLRELVIYDAETGLFAWRQRRRGCRPGAQAGSESIVTGQIQLMIDGRLYLAHRLAWLYVRGTFPDGQIDHINGVRFDNRFSNLRDVPAAVNSQNRRKPLLKSKSGFLGVVKEGRKFTARITVGGKGIYLGAYATPSEAHDAYLTAKRKLHPGCTI